MAKAVPYRARKNHKAGDPAVKPKCCKGEEKKVVKACSIDAKENTSFVKNQEERNKKRKKYNANPKHKHKKPIYAVRDKTWKDKHCMSTLFNYENPAIVKENLKKLKEELGHLEDDFETVLVDIGKGIAVDKVEKVAAVGGCAVVGGVVGGIVGFFFGGAGAVPGAALGAGLGESLCGAVAIADTVLDAASGAKEVWNNKEKIAQKIKELSHSKEQVEKLKEAVTELKDASDKKRKALKQKIYEEMGDQIKGDPCLAAKRCELKPYNELMQQKGKQKKQKRQRPMDAIFHLDLAGGCCPGQQAHHVIPSVKVQHCKGYNANKAPTVCVEGGKENGTHGKMHAATDKNTQDMVDGEGVYANGHPCGKKADTMDCTIEASAQAMMEVFKDSKCDKECIKKQLEEFYDKLCKGEKMTPRDRDGNEVKRSGSNTGGGRK